MSEHGPNVRKLIYHKMSLIMIPPGTKDGLSTAISAISKPGNISEVAKEATKWVEDSLALVKSAPDNPFKNDEEIAAAIIGEMEKKGLFRKSLDATQTPKTRT